MLNSGQTKSLYCTYGECHADDEICKASPVIGEADGPIPADEEKRSAEDIPRKLGEQLARHQGGPVVHPARTLPDFINIAHVNERHLKLVPQGHRDDGSHVDSL